MSITTQTDGSNTRTVDWRDAFGFLSVCTGIVALTVLAVTLVLLGKPLADTTAIVGVAASPIVALVSAYFGVSAATRGQAQAMQAQANALEHALASQREAER